MLYLQRLHVRFCFKYQYQACSMLQINIMLGVFLPNLHVYNMADRVNLDPKLNATKVVLTCLLEHGVRNL